MSKQYTPPHILPVSALSESKIRALLTPLLLSPCTDATGSRLYHQALEALFITECNCALRNCRFFLQGLAAPQRYVADLHTLTVQLLTAAKLYLHNRVLSLRLRGHSLHAAVCPRYLQLSLLTLVRAALQAAGSTRVCVDTARYLFCIAGNIPDGALSLPRAVAALHGGRVFRCRDTVFLSFTPDTEKTAYPRWRSSGVDGLIRDPLSCVRTAFSTMLYSSGSKDS